MKKLFTLLTMLIIGIGSTWGETGSITLTKSNIEFLRQYDNNTLDINNTGRNATRFASTSSPLVGVNNGGGNIGVSNFTIHSSGTNTIQMLEGYTITSYSITVTPGQDATFTATGGTADVTSLSASTQVTINVTGVNANSCSFKFTGNPNADYNTISQIVVNYSYTTAPTMVQTIADLSYANYASCPTYTITCQRSALYVDQNGTNLTTAHAVSSPTDARKKFAFIKNTSTGKYYLYNVQEGKFVNSDKSLANAPTYAVELHFTNNFSYPQYVRVGNNYMNVQESGSTSGGIVMNSYVKPDGGNSFVVEPSGTADLTKAHKIVNGWTATYHIDGASVTATADLTYNATLTLPTTLKRAYCSNYRFYSDVECEHEITTANDVYDDIYVKYTLSDCPFEFSTEESPVYYLLTGPSHGASFTTKYLYSNGSSVVGAETPSKADAYQWAFIGNPYGFVIKNKAGNYISTTATMSASGADFNLYQNTSAIKNSKTHFSAGIFNGNNQTVLNDNNQGTTISCYTSSSGAVTFTDDVKINNLQWAYFTPLASSDYAVITYNLKWGESSIQTASGILAAVDDDTEDYVPWTVPNEYSSFTYDIATVEESTAEVNVTLNWNGPFDISSDYESAVWYYIEANSQWMKNSPTWVAPNLDENIETVKGENGGMWAFTGNPYDGIVIMTKEKYDNTYEMHLSAAVEGNPAMYYQIGTTEKWSVNKITDKTFTLNISDKYLSENTTYHRLDYGTDATAATFSVRSYYCQLALDNWATFVGTTTGTNYFDVTSLSASNMEAMISGMTKMTETEYNANFATIPNNNISSHLSYNQPSTGFYRIKNNSTGHYLAYGQPAATGHSDKTAGLIAVSDANDLSTVIRLTAKLNNNDEVVPFTYYISTQGLNVQAQRTAAQAFPATIPNGVVFVFAPQSSGIVSISNTASDLTDGLRTGCLHESTWDKVPGVVNWNANADRSKWIVEDVTDITINLNSDGASTPTYYATLCAPFSYTVSGAKVYTLERDGKWLIPTEVEGEVEAGTPVLLKGSSTTATLTIGSGYSTTPLTGTGLTGIYKAQTVDTRLNSGNYVFGKNNGTVGFYHVDNQNFSLKANRAYLSLGSDISDAEGCRLMFDDDVTGISSMGGGQRTMDDESVIYNLSGQRLNKMQKGINIVNGKKVLF